MKKALATKTAKSLLLLALKMHLRQYAEGGWIGLGADEEWGGQGMPKMLTVLAAMKCYSRQIHLSRFTRFFRWVQVWLKQLRISRDKKKRIYLRFIQVNVVGTMCLTEPHAGTDLGIIKTKAERK